MGWAHGAAGSRPDRNQATVQANPATLHRRIAPMLATAGPLPAGPGWGFEFKWDGIRAVLKWDGEVLRVFSRNGHDITSGFPELRSMVGALISRSSLVLDGELIALDEAGRPSFELVQSRVGRAKRLSAAPAATFIVFDLLHLDGKDLTALPYRQRRLRLRRLGLEGPDWTCPRHHSDGVAMLEASRQMGLEGVVAKRLQSPYHFGVRSPDWVKVRNRLRQEFVIGGWSEGQNSRTGRLGSLLMGYYLGSGAQRRLVYVGRVGSGLKGTILASLQKELERLSGPRPFDATAAQETGRAVHFVKPELVAEVEFTQLTRAGRLRQAVFKGLRNDKDATDVVWEQTDPGAHGPAPAQGQPRRRRQQRAGRKRD